MNNNQRDSVIHLEPISKSRILIYLINWIITEIETTSQVANKRKNIIIATSDKIVKCEMSGNLITDNADDNFT